MKKRRPCPTSMAIIEVVPLPLASLERQSCGILRGASQWQDYCRAESASCFARAGSKKPPAGQQEARTGQRDDALSLAASRAQDTQAYQPHCGQHRERAGFGNFAAAPTYRRPAIYGLQPGDARLLEADESIGCIQRDQRDLLGIG